MSAPINLNQLPPPDVIEPLDFEAIFERRKQRFIQLFPENQQQDINQTLALESEPITKLLQENAYHELILRSRVNNAARAVMPAFSTGNDLDHLASLCSVRRLVIQPADNSQLPPIPEILESDDDFRHRIPQAFEGLSGAGPTGAYEFYALSADGRIADVSAISPTPACVTVTVLAREQPGTAPDELLQIVSAALNSEKIRPVGDRVTVQTAKIIDYQVNAQLVISSGPESELIKQAAENKLIKFIKEHRRLGRDIRLSALIATLHVEGVKFVKLLDPTTDLVLDRENEMHKTMAANCTDYKITVINDE